MHAPTFSISSFGHKYQRAAFGLGVTGGIGASAGANADSGLSSGSASDPGQAPDVDGVAGGVAALQVSSPGGGGGVAAGWVEGREQGGDEPGPSARLSQVLRSQKQEVEQERAAAAAAAAATRGYSRGGKGGRGARGKGQRGAGRGGGNGAFQGCGWAAVLQQGEVEAEASRRMGAAATREMFLSLPTNRERGRQYANDSVQPVNRTRKQV